MFYLKLYENACDAKIDEQNSRLLFRQLKLCVCKCVFVQMTLEFFLFWFVYLNKLGGVLLIEFQLCAKNKRDYSFFLCVCVGKRKLKN